MNRSEKNDSSYQRTSGQPSNSYGSLDNRNQEIYKNEIKKLNLSEKNKPSSLTNISANCYLNSGLQAISACSIFVSELSQLQSEYENLEKLKTFHDLIQILYRSDKRHLEISQNMIFQNWKKQGQQDSFELLSYVINQVYKEIRQHMKITKLADWLTVMLPMRLLIEHKIMCCRGSSISKQLQSDLALHIPIIKENDNKPILLQTLLDKYFGHDKIEQYSCDKKTCNGKEAEKIIRICPPLPNTICIHLQRMLWNENKMEKIKDIVKFDNEIIMKGKFILRDDNSQGVGDENYTLKSVIVHYGDVNFGHYICYKIFNGTWFYTSDSHIYSVEISRVLESEAYILFYEKSKNSSPINEPGEHTSLTTDHSSDRNEMTTVFNRSKSITDSEKNNNVDLTEKIQMDNNTNYVSENQPDKDSAKIDNYLTNSNPSVPDEYSKNMDNYFGSSDRNNPYEDPKKIDNDQTTSQQNAISIDNQENIPIDNYEMKISEFALTILIEALSACPMFIGRLRPMRDVNHFSNQYKSFVDRLISGKYSPNTSISHINDDERRHSEISPFMASILNSLFNDKNEYGIPIRSFDKCSNDKIPMMLYIQSKIECKCGAIIYPSIQYEFALYLTYKDLGLQEIINKFFDKQQIRGFDCKDETCLYKYGSIIVNLCKSPPDTLCIYLSTPTSIKMSELMHDINIKKSFFDLPGERSSEAKDYKYVLKSIISDPYNGKLECYKNHNANWLHVTSSEVKKVDKGAILRTNTCILFFEVEENNFKNSDPTKKDGESETTKNISIESIKSNCGNKYAKMTTNNSLVSNKDVGSAERAVNCFDRDRYYLKICLHAICSCDILMAAINDVHYGFFERSNAFIKLIKSFSQEGLNAKISDRKCVELMKSNESDLSHFMSDLLIQLLGDFKKNPLAIEITTTHFCLTCCSLNQCSAWKIMIDIVPQYRDDCLQSTFDRLFESKYVYNHKCVKYGYRVTARKERNLASIMKTICFNIKMSPYRMIFREYLTVKSSFLKNASSTNNARNVSLGTNSRNVDLRYRLVSTLSYGTRYGQHYCHTPRYCCFRKLGDAWYYINDRSIERIAIDEVLQFDSFMGFYELIQ